MSKETVLIDSGRLFHNLGACYCKNSVTSMF